MMSILDFRKVFFEEIVKSKLGYTPWIVAAPSHMANGFFREIGGGHYYNNEVQHRAINAKLNPLPNERERFYKKYIRLSDQKQKALQFMQENPKQRQMLSQSFRADKTVFPSINWSSYTLSHVQHTTNDNHDRDFGRWLTHVLQQGEKRPAYELLHLLLTQGATKSADVPAISDALSLMTLPLMEWDVKPNLRNYDYGLPANLTCDASGRFADPLVHTIRKAFDRLAENDRDSATRNGKLDALRRMTTLACFSFYLHLINIGEPLQGKLPLLLYLERDSQTLKRASQESYRLVRQSTDNFIYRIIKGKIEQLNAIGAFGRWDNQEAIQQHIERTIDWYSNKKEGSNSRLREEAKVSQFKVNCQNFYDSYRRTTANHEIEAIALALTDMVGMVFSETPATVARALGVKIGLLTRGDRRENKAYELHPDLLEVLVRASIPVGEEWNIKELAKYWYEEFGILFGGLGDENQKLAEWEIAPIDVNELKRNEQSLAQQLELSGYAQSYADGIVSVSVER